MVFLPGYNQMNLTIEEIKRIRKTQIKIYKDKGFKTMQLLMCEDLLELHKEMNGKQRNQNNKR